MMGYSQGYGQWPQQGMQQGWGTNQQYGNKGYGPAGYGQGGQGTNWSQSSWQGCGMGAGYGAPAAQAQPHAAQTAPAAAPPHDDGVGNDNHIEVTGCTHSTVGGIVRGSFTLHGENHGKPAYKRDQQVNSLDVMLYYWDERDGAAFCGWWFGPKIGGDQVWAYHPSRTAATAPKSGWKVPYDGPIDPTLIITGKSAPTKPMAQTQQAPAQAQQQSQQGQQWSQQPNQWAQANQWGPQQKQQWGQQQWGQAQQWSQAGQSQAQYYEEMKKKQHMQRAKHLDEMRKREEDLKKQQEEMRQKQQEEKALREAEMAKKREEQRATLVVRRAIQKARVATPENHEELKKELQDTLDKELENCGTQKERMVEESQKGLEQAQTRIEQILETRKKEEEQRAEEEKKRQEAQARAAKLFQELLEMVDTAEASGKKLRDMVEPLGSDDISMEGIESAAQAIEIVTVEARQKTKACTDYILKNGSELKEPRLLQGAQPTEERPNLATLLSRINDCARQAEVTISTSNLARTRAIKRAEARKKTEASNVIFRRYDKDNDGFLSRTEIVDYAKGEYNFDIPQDSLDTICKVLIEDGAAGVKMEELQRVKVAVGLAREQVRDIQKRAAREAKEKKLAEAKAALQTRIDVVREKVSVAEEAVKLLEAETLGLSGKGVSMVAADMFVLADQAETVVKDARDTVAVARTEIDGLGGEVDPELKAFLSAEVEKLEKNMARFEPRILRSVNFVAKFREESSKKQADELESLRQQGVKQIKFHHAAKKLTLAAMFDTFDTNNDGQIDEKEFLAFFSSPEREKDENEVELSTPSLVRLFNHLREPDEETISKDNFTCLIRVYMKVIKDTVITGGLCIKDTKTVRRLELNEVVEILEGPVKEETVDVMRVSVKAMKDGVQGWVTLVGNQGSKFLEEGGNTFKVVKETILTESFGLETSASKESTRKLRDTTRKLKEGEFVEVREWPRKEPTSGLMRAKCRALSDGSTGWATAVGNAGTVFLEVV